MGSCRQVRVINIIISNNFSDKCLLTNFPLISVLANRAITSAPKSIAHCSIFANASKRTIVQREQEPLLDFLKRGGKGEKNERNISPLDFSEPPFPLFPIRPGATVPPTLSSLGGTSSPTTSADQRASSFWTILLCSLAGSRTKASISLVRATLSAGLAVCRIRRACVRIVVGAGRVGFDGAGAGEDADRESSDREGGSMGVWA